MTLHRAPAPRTPCPTSARCAGERARGYAPGRSRVPGEEGPGSWLKGQMFVPVALRVEVPEIGSDVRTSSGRGRKVPNPGHMTPPVALGPARSAGMPRGRLRRRIYAQPESLRRPPHALKQSRAG